MTAALGSSLMRSVVFRVAYLFAIAAATIGWLWTLAQGLVWALGI
jgi:hypothetical protein